MEQIGIVTEVMDDAAVVKVQRHLACKKCGRCGMLSGADRREMVVEVHNPLSAAVGQKVYLETDDRQAIFVSFMLYIVPLAALVAGILLWPKLAAAHLDLAGNQDLAAVAVGFALMSLVFVGLRLWDRRIKETGRFRPVITGFVKEEDPPESD